MIKRMERKSVVAVVLSLLLLLTACSGQQENTKAESTQPLSISSKAQGEEETRIVHTPNNGDVEVPANPKRVIGLYTSIGDMLSLGVQPIAAVEYNINHPSYSEKMKGVSVLTSYEPESLMEHEPDLFLLTPDVDADELSKIAPVVSISYTEMTMDERVTLVGEILNKQEEAKQVLADFHEKADEAKSQLKQAGILDKTISIFNPTDSGFWVYGDKWGYGGGILYDALGFRAPELVEKDIIGGEQWRDVSLEVLKDYAGDYILFLGDLNSLKGDPIWESIPAVQQGRVIQFDPILFLDSDILSSFEQMKIITEALLNN